MEIVRPDIKYSRINVDFGKGFYTTPLLEQAQKWCNKFRKKKQDLVISVYNFDETAFEKCKIRKFESYSEDWLDFILKCRRGEDDSKYDIVLGGVANDKVFNTVELFFDGLIDQREAIRRLRYEKPNFQIAF